MNKYTELSDFEINKRVAIFIGFSCYYGDGSYTNGLGSRAAIVKGKNYHGYFRLGEFDPCNNPSDAMPIIIENKISLLAGDSNFWCARYGEWNILPCPSGIGFIEKAQVINDSPYRAAMELFLLMKDAERETNT